MDQGYDAGAVRMDLLQCPAGVQYSPACSMARVGGPGNDGGQNSMIFFPRAPFNSIAIQNYLYKSFTVLSLLY